MDVVLVLLRLIHIVAAFVWFGVGFTQTFIISPAVAASGVVGMRFALTMNESRLAQMIFPAAAGITMLAGILLYIVGNATSHFSQTGNMVLGIGAVFGIIAGIHGGMFTGRASAALGEAISKVSNGRRDQPGRCADNPRKGGTSGDTRASRFLADGGRAGGNGQRALPLAA